MNSLIIPAAGLSSRYPNMRPKWSITHPNGNLMLIESILGLDLNSYTGVYITFLKEHIDQIGGTKGIELAFEEVNLLDKLHITILEQPTTSQPETVAITIKNNNIHGAIFIKDTDNFFTTDTNYHNKNVVCTYNLQDMKSVNPSNKSYVSINDENIIENIVEKLVISSDFCCGGYGFKDADQFVKYFEELNSYNSKSPTLYISHIIYRMIWEGIQFVPCKVQNYEDWGTLEEWNKYKSQYCTLFIDVDGVLVKNSGKYFSPTWGETEGLTNNIKKINQLYDSGKVQIILTTCRQSQYKDTTIKQLKAVGLKYHQIVFDLLHGKRTIINDFSKTNPYESCTAINLPRNQDILEDML